MALLNKAHFNSLVSIEIKKNRKHESIATGFLIGFISRNSKDSKKRLYRIFLITNRHVFDNLKSVFLRFNKKSGGSVRFPVNLIINNQTTWLAHNNKKVDLAMLTISPQILDKNNVEWLFFNEEMFAYARKFQNIGIELGDEIFILGFPLGLAGKLQNFSIARSGIIARCDREILRDSRAFLIDAAIFPGNSGGPVLLKPELTSLTGTPAVNSVYLLGVVSGYLPYKEIIYSHQTIPPSYAGVNVENSGLAFVVPMDLAKQIYKHWIITKKRLERTQKGIDKTIQQKVQASNQEKISQQKIS